MFWFTLIVIGISFPILYQFSTTFKYCLKFIIYYLSLTIVATWLWPVTLYRRNPGDVRNINTVAPFMRWFSHKILGIYWVMDEKSENFLHENRSKSFVVMCNHQSSLDILGLLTIWPLLDRCSVVAKNVLKYAGPFGITAMLIGCTFIDRRKTKESYNTLNETSKWCSETKTKLFLFPEGTRYHHPTQKIIKPFKKGGFVTAINAQLPILPVVFSHFDFIGKSSKKFETGRVKITVLEPIETKGLTPDDADNLAKIAHNVMQEEFIKE